MKQVWLLVGVFVVGCGDDGGKQASDAKQADTPAGDAMTDAPAGSCTKPVVFISNGGMYTVGASDSRTNTDSSITSSVTFAGPGATRQTNVANLVRTALSAKGVQVTTTDPGTQSHVEIVLVTSNWNFANPLAQGELSCSFQQNGIGFANMTAGSVTDADAAGEVQFALGAALGLDFSTTAGNCMSDANAGCTFSTSAAVGGTCGASTQNQLLTIASTVGCP